MEKLKRDFIMKEFCRLAMCAIGLTVCLLVLLWCYPKLTLLHPMPFLAVIGVIGLAAFRVIVQVRTSTRPLTDHDLYLLEKEYTELHPVYKVWQGEIHLMQSFIVCRNRGRLLFIPIHKVDRVEKCFEKIGMRRVPVVKFILDTNQSISIGFSIKNPKDSSTVFSWLIDRIGREKVAC